MKIKSTVDTSFNRLPYPTSTFILVTNVKENVEKKLAKRTPSSRRSKKNIYSILVIASFKSFKIVNRKKQKKVVRIRCSDLREPLKTYSIVEKTTKKKKKSVGKAHRNHVLGYTQICFVFFFFLTLHSYPLECYLSATSDLFSTLLFLLKK